MSGDGEWDEKSDLTRIEDLSEFLHEEDPEVDAQLSSSESDSEESQFAAEDTLPDLPIPEEISNLDDLPDDAPVELQEEPFENEEAQETTAYDGDFSSDSSEFAEESSDFNNDFSSEVNDFGEEDNDFSSDASEFGEEANDFSGDTSNFGEDDQSFESEDFNDQNSDDQENIDIQETIDEYEANSDEDEATFGDNQEENEVTFDDNQEETNTDNDQELEEVPDFEEEAPSPPRPVETYQEEQKVAVTTTRENFQDLRDFGNAITYGIVTTGGQPPYSLILRGVKYKEDADDIKILLREHGLLTDENESTIDQGLDQGSLLISQISEYSAVYLAHKMRRFDLELRIGLSDQLHPSKSYEREGRGLVTKDNLKQNKEEYMEIESYGLEIEDIKIVTSSQIEGYSVHRYLDVISSHSIVSESDLYRHTYQEKQEGEDDVLLRNLLEQFPDYDEDSPVKDLGLNDVYQNLIDELRNLAYKKEANAVLGINFNITPIPSPIDSPQMPRYKITCTGNAVWIIDQPY